MSSEVIYKKSSRPIAMFLVCCLMCGVAFTLPLTVFSVFVPPLIGSLGAGVTQITLYFTMLALLSIVSCLVGPRLLRANAKITVTLAGVIMGLGYILLALHPAVPMVWLAGILAGLCYPLCSSLLTPIIINNWFAKNNGTFVGIAFSMVGIFGAILSPVFTSIIQSVGWQPAMIALGVIILVVIGLLGLTLITMSPLPLGILPYGATQEEAELRATGGVGGPKKGVNPKLPGLEFGDIFKTPGFYMVAIAAIFFGFVGGMNTQLNTISQVSGFDPVTAGFAVTALSVGMFVGKILNGAIKDKFGAVAAIVAACILGIVAFLLFLGSIKSGAAVMLYAAALLAGFCTCLANVGPPLLTGDTFGPRDFGNILGVMTACPSIGLAAAAPIYGAVFNGSGSYTGVLIILIVVIALEAILTSVGIKAGRKAWRQPEA